MTKEELSKELPTFVRAARAEANRVIALGRFHAEDREDLEQELLLQLCRRSSALAPQDEHPSPFVRAIVRNRSTDLVRHELRECRDRRKLHFLAETEDAPTAPSVEPLAVEFDPGLRMDVDIVLGLLDPAKRRFASLLTELPLSGAASVVGVSRATGWRWKAEIRRLLQRYGLGPTRRRPTKGQQLTYDSTNRCGDDLSI